MFEKRTCDTARSRERVRLVLGLVRGMPPQPGLRQNQGRGRAWATRPARARVCWISGHRCDSATQRCRGQRQRCANRVEMTSARGDQRFQKPRGATQTSIESARDATQRDATRRRSRARLAGPRRRGGRRRRHRRARLVGAPAEEGQRARRRGRRAAAAAHGGSAEGRGVGRSRQS